MEFARAASLTLPALTRLWNLGYSGYFIPIQFSDEQMAGWVTSGSLDLGRSLLLVDQGEPVGISVLGVRGERGWIGGFGIAPDYRGRGLAQHLMDAHVDLLRAEGPPTVQLEVLVENWAQKVYARAGFAITRRLSVLQGKLPEEPGGSGGAGVKTAAGDSTAGDNAVADVDPAALLAHSERLHKEHPACWQREAASITPTLNNTVRALYTGPADAPTGMLLYQAGERVRLIDGAAVGLAEAQALLAGLARRAPGLTGAIVNEPEFSPFHQALTGLGWVEAKAQWEMHWER